MAVLLIETKSIICYELLLGRGGSESFVSLSTEDMILNYFDITETIPCCHIWHTSTSDNSEK